MDEIKTSDISAENRAEILNIIENFRLMDDTFMSKVFEDKEIGRASCRERV